MLNLQAPISRLPPDMLLAIFFIIRDDSVKRPMDRDTSASMRYYNPKPWLNFTQVCHTWREVAVNTPLLWSRIAASRRHHEYTLEMLRRSMHCPLELDIDLVNLTPWHVIFLGANLALTTQIIDDLKRYMGRCRALRLRVSTQSALREFLAHCAPSLEYLTCDGSEPGHLVLEDTFLQPPNALRHLELHACNLDWNAHFLSNLTHLRLNEIREDNRLSRVEFIEFLSRLSGLEELHLEQNFLRDANEGGDLTQTAGPKCQLKQLRYLRLTCTIQEITYFLNGVTLPHFCKFRLGRLIRVDSIISIHHLRRWIAKHFDPPHVLATATDAEMSYFRSFCINCHDSELTLRGFYDVLSHDTLHTMCDDDAAMLEISLHCNFGDDTDLVLWGLLCSPPLSRINFFGLYCDSTCFIPSSQIWSIFSSLTTLKSVYIDAFYLNFFHSLGHDSFPTLSSVALRRASSGDLQHILGILLWCTTPLQELLLPPDCIVPPAILPRMLSVVSHIGYLSS